MDTKQCTKCKIEKPNTKEFFHLDKAKVKLGHNIILAAACKDCKNAQKRITAKIRRQKIAQEYGTVYQYKKLIDKDFVKKCRVLNRRYKDKIIERNKQYRKEKRDFIIKSDIERGIKNKRDVKEITDYYIARLITRNDNSITINEILDNKEFIDLYRINLKLKRLCTQLKT